MVFLQNTLALINLLQMHNNILMKKKCYHLKRVVMHKVSAAYENDIGVHTRTVHLSENCISVDQMCFYMNGILKLFIGFVNFFRGCNFLGIG